jgi:coniferyl-aldehyde dehydrogenase
MPFQEDPSLNESALEEDGETVADPIAALQAGYDRLRAAWNEKGGLSYDERMRHLKALSKAVKARKDELVAAVNQDYGNRSAHETGLAEIMRIVESAAYARANLLDWTDAQEREVGWQLRPATARVIYQPKGVVGIMAPWNYPIQLSLDPLVAALAAGCRSLIKPSELTPATGAAIEKILRDTLPAEVVQVVHGDGAVGAAFASLPLDHLLFTGSTRVGKMIMKAASEHLTPLTLELGGKSPTIIHPSFSIAKAAERIAWAKCFNAGQTCVAPDYVMVHKDQLDSFVTGLQASFAKMYPKVAGNPDYTCIINDHHHRRLLRLVSEAEQRGVKVVRCTPTGETEEQLGRRLPLTILVNPPTDAAVMQDEIFGPVLPVVPYTEVEECIRFVNGRPRPLALYYFDNRQKRIDDVLARTTSGGAGINECLVHVTQESMPFGGVGPSGMGSYHGYSGFLAFSHEKSVMQQSRINGMAMLNPPYGGVANLFGKLSGI